MLKNSWMIASALLFVGACQTTGGDTSAAPNTGAFDGVPWQPSEEAQHNAVPDGLDPDIWAGDLCQPAHLVPGEEATWYVSGYAAGDVVHFGMGTGTLDNSEGVLLTGGVVLNLYNAFYLCEGAVADDDGNASCTVTVPETAPVGLDVHVQVVNQTRARKSFVSSNVVIANNTDYVGACRDTDVCVYADCCYLDVDSDGICDGADDCVGYDGEQLDCAGACVDENSVGDGFCDSELYCEETEYDGGDCWIGDACSDLDGDEICDFEDACPLNSGELFDCVGDCMSDWELANIGDGLCDIEFDCADFDMDGGDCVFDTDFVFTGDGSIDVQVAADIDFWWAEGLMVVSVNGVPATPFISFYYEYMEQTVDLNGLEAGDVVCVDLNDSFGDGGISGTVTNLTEGMVELEWAGAGYDFSATHCVEIGDDVFGSTTGDGDGCPAGYGPDCAGACVGDWTLENWATDSFCTDGEGATSIDTPDGIGVQVDLDCADFLFDGGACDEDHCIALCDEFGGYTGTLSVYYGCDCSSPYTAPEEEECDAPIETYLGDGYCDSYEPYNSAACGWDGGDCCESTCEDSTYDCGTAGYLCLDPAAPDVTVPTTTSTSTTTGGTSTDASYLTSEEELSDYDIDGGEFLVTLGDDEVSEAIDLGFSFNYYGEIYDTIQIVSNGGIYFGDGHTDSQCCSGYEMPEWDGTSGYTTAWSTWYEAPDYMPLAAWWADLNPTLGGRITYDYGETSTGESFMMVDFYGIFPYGGDTTDSEEESYFQIVLYESGNFDIRVLRGYGDGSTYAVGFQRPDGMEGETLYYGYDDVLSTTYRVLAAF